MHEVAIAESVARIALERANGRRVRRVGMVVGRLRQVVPDALRFGFELVTAGTNAEGAEVEIEAVPAAGLCDACGRESEQRSFPFRCAACGGLDVRIVRGEELRVEWLDLETEDEGAPTVETSADRGDEALETRLETRRRGR